MAFGEGRSFEAFEANERSARLERLSASLVRLFPGESKGLKALREKIRESFDVPQWGDYHNEGLFMDAHLDLILRNIDDIKNGSFPDELPEEIRTILVQAARQQTETLERYTFLHDISKMDCLRLSFADGSAKNLDWAEWRASLPDAARHDPAALRAYLETAGIVSVSYYHASEKAIGKEGKKHGEAGAEELRGVEGLDVSEAVLTAIAKHEVAYQFTEVNAATYERHLTKVGERPMSDEERALAITASYIDTMASLRHDGKPDLGNFLALAVSKKNFEVHASVKTALEADASLDKKKVELALRTLRDKKEPVREPIAALIDRLRSECRPAAYDHDLLARELGGMVAAEALTATEMAEVIAAVRKGEAATLGKRFGKKMQYIKKALDAAEILRD